MFVARRKGHLLSAMSICSYDCLLSSLAFLLPLPGNKKLTAAQVLTAKGTDDEMVRLSSDTVE